MSDFGVFLLLFAFLAAALGLIKFFAWLTDWREAGGFSAYARKASERYVVNTNQQSAPNVMSRSDQSDDRLPASVSQTDRQTDDRPPAPVMLPRDVMFDICKDLRAHGYSREAARAFLRKVGQPLDNNLWAQAALPAASEPEHLTPIAGRRTDAVFDADFPYQAPPKWNAEPQS